MKIVIIIIIIFLKRLHGFILFRHMVQQLLNIEEFLSNKNFNKIKNEKKKFQGNFRVSS